MEQFISKVEAELKEYKELKNAGDQEKFFKGIVLEKEDLQIQNIILLEKLSIEKARKYAKKSEKTISPYIQISLFDNSDIFNEAETIADEGQNTKDEYEVITYKRKKRLNKVNQKNENLVTVEIEHKLEGNDCLCPKCNQELIEMGHKEVRTYNFVPAKLELNIHKEYSYKCNHCSKEDKALIVHSKRITSFPKLMVEDSFVSNVIVEKYLKHVPLYRQEKVFNNMGLEVTRKNFSNWIIKAAFVLKPLYFLLYKNIISSDICHMDETPLQVITNEADNAYIWGLTSSKYDKEAYIYIYERNRKHENASKILNGFKGYVHSDGYAAYKRVPDAINVGCFAHARRKYMEIIKASDKDSDFHKLALEGKRFIDRLYSIEHIAKKDNFNPDKIFELRQKDSLPIITEYETWLLNNPYKIYSQLGITKAINYSLNALPELKNYLKDGRLEIDNNRAERMMKSFVIGRKNFLFCFTESGAEASALLYSIVETAYANNLKVEQYLTYVFKTLPLINIKNIVEVSELLPYSDKLPKELKIQQ
jgi:transposase